MSGRRYTTYERELEKEIKLLKEVIMNERLIERRIVCAAIRNEGGCIICSARHYDGLMCMQIENSMDSWNGITEQGFIDQRGEFLSRVDAWDVALEAGQIIHRVGGDEKGVLFSENLY